MATDVAEEMVVSPPRTEIPLDRQFRIPLGRYEAMVEQWLLRPSDRLVLLDGFLVKKMTKGSKHSAMTTGGIAAMMTILPAGWHVRSEQPVRLPNPEGGDSEPEPDLAVVSGIWRDYLTRHPGPAEVALLVEYADSSVAEDRAGLWRYARAGIPVVWLVNIPSQVIEVYTEPTGPVANAGYKKCEVKKPGETLTFHLGEAGPVGPIAVESLLA
jgi:Uma2 family endonuclease